MSQGSYTDHVNRETEISHDTVNDYIPGRSLLAEMTDLKDQMTALKAAMVQLVELQQELAQKVEAALNFRNSAVEETHHASQN
jgi:hypothetical protein